MGFVMPVTSILVLIVPFVHPIVTGTLGFDGIWFGIIFTKLIEIAVITPPMGINLYIIKGVFPEVSLPDIIRGTWWFLVMDILTLAILIAFPQLTLWLPSMMRGG